MKLLPSTGYCALVCFQWWHAGHACGLKQRDLVMCPLALAYVLATTRAMPLFPRKPLGNCNI
jgi:hypothetical protein